MINRIESEGIEEYNRIKELAKVDKNFQPYLRWFHGKENKLSDHEKKVQLLFSWMHNRTRPRMSYSEIAKVADCSDTTVSMVMNGHNQLSKDLADKILRNIEAYKKNL